VPSGENVIPEISRHSHDSRRHTVWFIESIGYYTDQSGLGVESVDLVRQNWCWTEVLQEPISDICKVHFLISGMDSDIVERAELPSKVVVQDHCHQLE